MGSFALSYQNLPPPPPRDGTTTAAPAAPTQAPAQAPSEPGFGPFLMMLLVIPMLLFIMWSGRSQQKKQQQLLSTLAKGDRVVTQGGLVGKFIEMNDRVAKIEIAPGVKIDVLRSGIMGKDTPETAAAVEKAAAEKK